MTDPERARNLRRRRVHERQAVVFGVLLAGIAVIGLGAAAVYTGSVSVPFLSRGFAAEPTATHAVDPYPCPPKGAKPVAYNKIVVNVYNTTDRAGLASATAAEFEERHFKLGKTGNASPYSGVAVIVFGRQGIAAGYTVAAQVPDSVLKLDARKGTSVDVLIGDGWDDVAAVDDVDLDPGTAIPTPSTCTPLDQLGVLKPTATPHTTPAKK
ncbi:LytR C-terminal domain-containing protein [Cellulomonas alba]|uniref:LytR C-terminal domain-containing protein n=1 Tax=Cellulomonas alba TaxID=3053467 RepID=A0ABT7SET5_9CELL|nr:LytR C-terminal domain-containing protein [Cellulomonas alba]MDM7854708.1 LytR C-terminal domain-containing protein [Cellulomonas alba]